MSGVPTQLASGVGESAADTRREERTLQAAFNGVRASGGRVPFGPHASLRPGQHGQSAVFGRAELAKPASSLGYL